MSAGTVDNSGTINGLGNEPGGLPAPSAAQAPTLRLTFDPQEYLAFMDGLDLTLEEKIDMLHTLWQMMASFVDRAWGIDSVQLLPAFNEFTSLGAHGTLQPEDMSATPPFNDAAHGNDAQKGHP